MYANYMKVLLISNKYDGMEKHFLEVSLKNYFQTKKETNLPILGHQVSSYREVIILHTSASLDE
jgi:hypothetical protein